MGSQVQTESLILPKSLLRRRFLRVRVRYRMNSTQVTLSLAYDVLNKGNVLNCILLQTKHQVACPYAYNRFTSYIIRVEFLA